MPRTLTDQGGLELRWRSTEESRNERRRALFFVRGKRLELWLRIRREIRRGGVAGGFHIGGILVSAISADLALTGSV